MSDYIKEAPSASSARQMFSRVRTRERILYLFHWLSGGALSLTEVFGLSMIAGLLSDGSLSQALLLIIFYALLLGFLRIVMIQTDAMAFAPFNSIRGDYFLKSLLVMTSMDLKYFENPSFQDEIDIAERAISNNLEGLEGIYHKFFPLGADVVSWIVLGAVMATLRPWLFPLYLVPVVIYVAVTRWVSSRQNTRRAERQSSERKNNVYSRSASDFKYGKDSRLYNLRQLLLQRFTDEIEKLREILTWHYRLDVLGFSISFVAIILVDLLSFYLLILARTDGISLEKFVLYLSALTAMSLIMLRLAQSITFLFKEFRDVRRYFGYINGNWSSASGSYEQELTKAPSIRFENVSFSYPNTDKKVIDNVSFTLEAGKKVALVGINGAGKTTLMKLLMGLYRPDSGHIYIDGIDYHAFSLSDMRKIFAVVFQEVEPLSITIAQHVSCKYEDIDRQKVERALRRAGIWKKVESLEKGMDSMLLKVVDEKGVIFSGGENQKLMIARALYREEAKIMVMDEPTAALDALAEAEIYREFDSIMHGLTGFFISHRLASTQFCDEILLMDEGRIAERGTHRELMESGGIYHKMYETQKKYYQEAQHEEA